MLEKPDIADKKIVTCLLETYGMSVETVEFLPLGRDVNTAVYRLVAADKTDYFFKIRSGPFDETSVRVHKFLVDQGISQIIPLLPAKNGRLWGILENYKTILYPFVEGGNGYEITLSDHHWLEFGLALKSIHSLQIPAALRGQIREERYSPTARQTVREFLERIETEVYDDQVARETAAFMKSKRSEILDLIETAERLARKLQADPPPFTLCHSDLHAGNILIGTDDAFYIVDWDEPIMAPKERDLMYVGGALLASKRSPEEEALCFYPAYGQVPVNVPALAYYRFERIIQDIFEYCKSLLMTNEGGEDRALSLYYLKSNFLPGSTIDSAYQTI